jgi:ferredoxin
MIIAERKPLAEILEMIEPHKRVLFLGCQSCVAVCLSGGEKETHLLAEAVRLARKRDGKPIEILEDAVKRQCDREFIEPLGKQINEVEAVLSLACGAGVQTMAELFQERPVYPAVNTKFIGMNEGFGSWSEMCLACGDCILDLTGGICPIARCPKSLLNGPCGGTQDGKCEVDRNKDCAWTLIYQQLKRQGKLELMKKYRPPRNHQAVIRPGRVVRWK